MSRWGHALLSPTLNVIEILAKSGIRYNIVSHSVLKIARVCSKTSVPIPRVRSLHPVKIGGCKIRVYAKLAYAELLISKSAVL